MLASALLGGVVFTVLFLKFRPVFRQSHTIAYDWKVAGAMIGAILGFSVELGLRVLNRSHFRVKLSELLVAMIPIAAAVAVIGALVRWLTT